MITPGQIRMARAGLGWTIEELCSNSGVSARTIKRIENAGDVMSANMRTIVKIKTCLETGGIEFIGSPEDGPGVRIRSAPRKP
jgi:transcriptional regulator with XRE-family HTH domain